MTDETSSTLKVSYYYDGSLPLAEKVDGKMKQIYINDGEGILGFVRYIYNDSGVFLHYQHLYYLYDSLGSVSYITGENGLPLQNYTYSPYGTCLNVTDDPINNLQFVGRYGGYKDNDTGLIYFWHRWYDSKDGRWISRDPIGVKGGINLYGYVNNRPNLWFDEKGLCPDTGCNEDRSCDKGDISSSDNELKQYLNHNNIVHGLILAGIFVAVPHDLIFAGCFTTGPGFIPCMMAVEGIVTFTEMVGIIIDGISWAHDRKQCFDLYGCK